MYVWVQVYVYIGMLLEYMRVCIKVQIYVFLLLMYRSDNGEIYVYL